MISSYFTSLSTGRSSYATSLTPSPRITHTVRSVSAATCAALRYISECWLICRQSSNFPFPISHLIYLSHLQVMSLPSCHVSSQPSVVCFSALGTASLFLRPHAPSPFNFIIRKLSGSPRGVFKSRAQWLGTDVGSLGCVSRQKDRQYLKRKVLNNLRAQAYITWEIKLPW